MDFQRIMNPVEVVSLLAQAMGGRSQVSPREVGLALAGRYINQCGETPINGELLRTILDQAYDAWVQGWDEARDEDILRTRAELEDGFYSRFAFWLYGKDYLTTFFHKEQWDTPEALAWANGTDWRQIGGAIPQQLANIRGKWDKAYA